MEEKMKKKLKLEDIKIESFVTSLSEEERIKIYGGKPGATEPDDTCVNRLKSPVWMC